jgi:hypothetical protein
VSELQIQEELIRSCHDCSDGELGVALAETLEILKVLFFFFSVLDKYPKSLIKLFAFM